MNFCTLIILDGFGENSEVKGNAIRLTGTPYIDSLKKRFPYTYIEASGEAVGKVAGQMGDSEVGHMNMGSGRVVMQNILLINNAIKDGSFFKNERILSVLKHVKDNNSALHLFGLLSDGGVHSMYQHLFAYIEAAKQQGIDKVYVHVITDGRDTGVKSGRGYIDILEKFLKKTGIGKIASITGRAYAMDREKNYDRTKKFYDCIIHGDGEEYSSADEAIKASYDSGVTDEFVTPKVILDKGIKHTIQDGDSVIFFNFRKDRAVQILQTLVNKDFDKFDVVDFKDIKVLTPIPINAEFENTVIHAFDNQTLANSLCEVVCKDGGKVLKVSESTKYAHVTYYFNGAIEEPFENEDRKLFVSDKIQNFAEQPRMQADKIGDYVVDQIKNNDYRLIVVNVTNGDMIGHTGDMEAAKVAVQVIDEVTKNMVEATLKKGGFAIVTADHGNIEQMLTPTGEPFTAHTTNKVPFIVADYKSVGKKLYSDGKLADVAPTILDLLDMAKPDEMNGKSLIK